MNKKKYKIEKKNIIIAVVIMLLLLDLLFHLVLIYAYDAGTIIAFSVIKHKIKSVLKQHICLH